MTKASERYQVRVFPTLRRAYVDVLREGQRGQMNHGLVEVDVTRARAALAHRRDDDGSPLSFTGWLVACREGG